MHIARQGAFALMSFALAFAFNCDAGAQTTASPSVSAAGSYLRGYWRVKVEGETRLRELAIFSGSGREGQEVLAASYGWIGAELTAVKAAASSRNNKIELELVTPAASTIQAQEQDSNTLAGIFRANVFVSKPVTLTRVTDKRDLSGSAFGDEDKDFQVAPTDQLTTDYHRDTPLTVPGGKTLKTADLWDMLTGGVSPVIVDVLDGKPGKRTTLPTAVWVGSRFGLGIVGDGDRQEFAGLLAKLTKGDKAAPLVFLCLDARCWLSYNASLRALQEGYTNVFWYRGGWRAWTQARLPMTFAEPWGK